MLGHELQKREQSLWWERAREIFAVKYVLRTRTPGVRAYGGYGFNREELERLRNDWEKQNASFKRRSVKCHRIFVVKRDLRFLWPAMHWLTIALEMDKTIRFLWEDELPEELRSRAFAIYHLGETSRPKVIVDTYKYNERNEDAILDYDEIDISEPDRVGLYREYFEHLNATARTADKFRGEMFEWGELLDMTRTVFRSLSLDQEKVLIKELRAISRIRQLDEGTLQAARKVELAKQRLELITSLKGRAKGKITCNVCGKQGYLQLKEIRGHTYPYVRHVITVKGKQRYQSHYYKSVSPVLLTR